MAIIGRDHGTSKPSPLVDAVLGTTLEMLTLDGDVTVTIPQGPSLRRSCACMARVSPRVWPAYPWQSIPASAGACTGEARCRRAAVV